MLDLRTFTFGKGSHKSREEGLCVMEAVAMLEYERKAGLPAGSGNLQAMRAALLLVESNKDRNS